MSDQRTEWAVMEDRDWGLASIPGCEGLIVSHRLAGPFSSPEEADAFCVAHSVGKERLMARAKERGLPEPRLAMPYVASRRIGEWSRGQP